MKKTLVFTLLACSLFLNTAVAQTLPERGQVIVRSLYQQHTDKAASEGDGRRSVTKRIAEQLAFEFGPQYGWKRADAGRPPSQDVFALQVGDRLYGWDWWNGSTNRPNDPVGNVIDITGQVFIPVQPVNHLGGDGSVPVPIPPTPNDNLEDAVAALHAEFGAFRQHVEIALATMAEQQQQEQEQILGIRTSLEEHRAEARKTRNQVVAFLSNWKTIAAAAGFLVGKFGVQ